MSIENTSTTCPNCVQSIVHHGDLAEKIAALGCVSGGIFNEFAGLLSVISASVETVPLCGSLNAEQTECLESALMACARSKDTLNRLKGLSHSEPNRREFINLRDWTRNASAFVRALPASGISFSCQCERDFTIYIDPGLLDATFVNLIQSAANAMCGEGEIGLAIRSAAPSQIPPTLYRGASTEFVCLSVLDTSAGDKRPPQHRLLDRILAAKPVQDDMAHSMAFVGRFARRFGGTAKLDPNYKSGRKVDIILPMARPC